MVRSFSFLFRVSCRAMRALFAAELCAESDDAESQEHDAGRFRSGGCRALNVAIFREDRDAGGIAVHKSDAGSGEGSGNAGYVLGEIEITAARRAGSTRQPGHVGGRAVLRDGAVNAK